MKSSDCIVAVNTDKNAPIFDVAHYGVVGDVAEILPQLLAKVKEAQNNV
jgi:electron transfer flavoprotein alpha subunit